MTVISNLTEVDDCDTAGGGSWAIFNISGTMGALNDVDSTSEDMTVNVEGTQCYGFDCDKESGGYEYPLPATTDMSKQHLYIWVCVPTGLGGLQTAEPVSGQSGIFLTARDSSGNRGYWHVAGSDTYDGSWQCFVAYLGDTPDTNSGTAPTMTNIDYVGFGVNHPNAKSKAACNIFFDVCRYGNAGISVYGGSQGSELDFDHIADQDETNAFGIFRKNKGVFFSKGPIKFGHDSNSCYFKDTGQVVVFEDVPHTSGELYKFEIIEGSGQTTEFQLGNKSGTQGIQGCFVSAPGGKDWNLLVSGETVNQFNLYGSTFSSLKDAILSQSGEKEVLSCAFVDQASGEVYPKGISFDYNNIINPVAVGMVIDDDTVPLPEDCNFIACPVGIEFRASGEYTFTDCVFTNCTKDVWNNSGGSLTLNASGTTNFTSYSGENVTIVNTKYHRLTGVAQNSKVTYVSGEGYSAIELHSETVDADGLAQYDYNYAGDFVVDILVNHLSYEPWEQTVELSSLNSILPVSQVTDRVYANP